MSSQVSQRRDMLATETRKTPAELLIERETLISIGRVPRGLYDEEVAEGTWQMRGDQFLLRAQGDHYFHYRSGRGITIERGYGAQLDEEPLWLNGSVYAAIASINGLLPIHASAVAVDGKVFAFTGLSGAGKSTLAAALCSRGMRLFADDTLLLDLSASDEITCLPGHKRLKLLPDALPLTGAIPEERVSRAIDKFYARPLGGHVQAALPMSELIFIEESAELRVDPVNGAERLMRLQDDHYTTRFFTGARGYDRAGQFVHLARLAERIRMSRFRRPLDRKRFDECIDFLVRHIRREAP